ncbi:hypothetical protein AGR8A_pTi20082 [Agrobacterium fabrum str. J-07]|nr:hypothetical protein AGR8A_pTi20082 [Agrobacterium fabrum str. J-07]
MNFRSASEHYVHHHKLSRLLNWGSNIYSQINRIVHPWLGKFILGRALTCDSRYNRLYFVTTVLDCVGAERLEQK